MPQPLSPRPRACAPQQEKPVRDSSLLIAINGKVFFFEVFLNNLLPKPIRPSLKLIQLFILFIEF